MLEREASKRNNLIQRMIRPGTICRESNFMKSIEKNKKDNSPYKSQKLEEDSVVCEDNTR
jgi:hypothetical protein